MAETTELTEDLPTLTVEIKILEDSLKQELSRYVWEIGKRLNEAKNILRHGTFTSWVEENFEFTTQYARRFMAFYSDNPKGNPGFVLPSLKHFFELIQLPSDIDRASFISSPHTIPSTGVTKSVDEMSVRELREVKAALRAEREARELAEARAEKAEDDYGLMCDTLEAVRAQPPRTEYVADPNVSERLRKYEERYGDIDELGRTAFATNTQDLTASVMSFSRAVRDFAKRYAYMAQYSSAIVTLDPLTAREYTEAVSALRDLVSVFPNGQYARTDVIDADYNIIEGEY